MRKRLNNPTPKWAKILNDYLVSDLTPKEYSEKHGINNGSLCCQITRYGIADRKRAILAQAKAKAFEIAEERWKSFYLDMDSGQIDLWTKVKNKANELLENKKIKPKQLSDLTASIERMLKSYRLMEGKPTEKVESESKNIHLAAVQVIKAIKNEP